MPYPAKPPPRPLERSCMGTMLSMIFPPVMRRPSREITAEIAHPDGMRTCPSFFMMFTLSKEKGVHSLTRSSAPCRKMNAFAHSNIKYSGSLARKRFLVNLFSKKLKKVLDNRKSGVYNSQHQRQWCLGVYAPRRHFSFYLRK